MPTIKKKKNIKLTKKLLNKLEGKTIKKWFQKGLTSKVSKKAIDNTPPIALNTKCPSLRKALFNAFQWEQSPEGFEFWKNIFDTLPKEIN